jgi:hypothetical protein
MASPRVLKMLLPVIESAVLVYRTVPGGLEIISIFRLTRQKCTNRRQTHGRKTLREEVPSPRTTPYWVS